MNKFILTIALFLSFQSRATPVPDKELPNDLAHMALTIAYHPLKCVALFSTPGYVGDDPEVESRYLSNRFSNLSDLLTPHSNPSYEAEANTSAGQTIWMFKYYDHYHDFFQTLWVTTSKDMESVTQVVIDNQNCSLRSTGTPFCKQLSFLECR